MILKNSKNVRKILKNGNVYTERQENSLEALPLLVFRGGS